MSRLQKAFFVIGLLAIAASVPIAFAWSPIVGAWVQTGGFVVTLIALRQAVQQLKGPTPQTEEGE